LERGDQTSIAPTSLITLMSCAVMPTPCTIEVLEAMSSSPPDPPDMHSNSFCAAAPMPSDTCGM